MNSVPGIYLLSLLLIPCTLQCMEKPIEKLAEKKDTQEIPLLFLGESRKEQSRFSKYQLDEPQFFTALLQEKLNKNNSDEYVNTLQRFASKLLIQHMAMEKVLHFTAMSIKSDEFENLRDKCWKKNHAIIKMGPRDPSLFIFYPETTDQLNEFISHDNLIKDSLKNELSSFNELAVVLDWAYDQRKGTAFNLAGKWLTFSFLANRLPVKKYGQSIVQLLNFAYPLCIDSEKEIPLLSENNGYIFALADNIEQYNENKWLNESANKKKNASILNKDFHKTNQNIVDRYLRMMPLYAKLYEKVYGELKQPLIQKMRASPDDKNIIKNLNVLVNNTESNELLPSRLPNSLRGFQPCTELEKFAKLEKKIEETRLKCEQINTQDQGKVDEIAELRVKIRQKFLNGKRKNKKEEQNDDDAPHIIAQAEDGSCILEGDDTEKNITILDPKNEATIVIFKTSKSPDPIQITAIKYTSWVNMWFEDSRNALETQGYTNEQSLKYTSPHLHWRPILLHSFAKLADNFILKYGKITQIPSRRFKGKNDILVTMPGMIIDKNNQKETGVYAYLIDSDNGQWYHRMFEPQSGTKLIQDLFGKGCFCPGMEGFYDVFFPPLATKNNNQSKKESNV